MMPHDGPLPLLARLFAEAGNALHETAPLYRTGHLPVHTSDSGECVHIDSPGSWQCWACADNGQISRGGLVAAVRSLIGIDTDTWAENWLSEHYPLTLERFAEERCLPVEFLLEMGIEREAEGIAFAYKDAHGRTMEYKRRWAYSARIGSKWPAETPVMAYGLEDKALAEQQHYWLLVEGETDRLTARFLGHPALGIPGAKNAKVITIDLLELVGTVYIWEESDKGGKEFVKGVTQHVKNLGYQGTIRVVKHEKAKDLSQLHQWNPELTKRRLSDLLKTAAEVQEDEIKETTREGAAKKLVELVEDECELVHDNRQVCFARVPVGTHLELYSVKSMMFRRWLQYRFYQVEGRPPPREAMASALLQIEALAQFEGEQRDVHLRIAPDREDGIYIDLGDDHWRCIHVSPSMWAVEAHDRIFFRRSAGMQALPMPLQDGDLTLLKRHMNILEEDWCLILSWMLSCYLPKGPYSVLHLMGEQGSAKTLVARMLRSLIDPAIPPVRSSPKEVRDMAIAANSCWVQTYDNLSGIPEWMSNVLARLSTGDGWTTRQLFTDEDEVLFMAQRPSILTSIGSVITMPDLLDRTVGLVLPVITTKKRRYEYRQHRREEPGILDDFEADKASILGGLLGLLSRALEMLPELSLREYTRMATYMRMGAAIERAQQDDWTEEGSVFLRRYKTNLEEGQAKALQAALAGPALLEWLAGRDWEVEPTWTGTYDKVIEGINSVADAALQKKPAWPDTSTRMGNFLRMMAPALRDAQYETTFGQESRTRRATVTFRKIHPDRPDDPPEGTTPAEEGKKASQASHPSKPSAEASSAAKPPSESEASHPTSKASHPEEEDACEALEEACEAPDFDKASHGNRPQHSVSKPAKGAKPLIPALHTEGGPRPWKTPEPHRTIEVGMSFELPPVTLITSTNGLENISRTLMRAPAIALDTETIRANTADTRPDPRRDRLRLIQLATPEQTYVIDCEKVFPGVLWDLFKRQDLTLIGHNIAFDLQALRSANAPWPDCNLIDTMLAVQVLGMGMAEPKASYSLGDVVDFFLGSPLDKSLQRSDWSGDLSEEQLRYAAVDTAILLPLWAEILPRLQRAELVKIAALEGNVAAGVAWMSWNGMKVDRQRWLAQADVQRVRRAALDGELNEMAGRTINWASAKAQVLPLLRARGLAIEKTDEDTLTPYVTDPVVSKLLERREAAVLAQTYGEKWLRHIHPDTGRVHPEFLQCNSRAGRMIANHPNLQNIPRHHSMYRTFFVAEEGNILIKGDYDQIEMRLAALISGDERMIAAYQRGEDLHRLTASGLLDVPVEQITKQQRQLAKPVNFGLIYSMSAPGLQRYAYKDYRVEMTVEQAKAHRDRWFELYPGIADWQRRIDRNLRARGTLDTRTLMGRRRHSVDYPGAAYNSPVQGSAADGCKLALVQVYRQWHRYSNIKLVNMVHDELVLEVSADIVEDISHDLQQAMYEPMVEMVGGRIPIKVEITTGPTWGGG